MFKNYFILGSGFGLYGYLPSLIKLDKKIHLFKKYEKKILIRKDLKKYISNINFVEKINFKKIDSIIFAKRPKDQFNFVSKLKKKKFLYLEKPLSEDPKKSLQLINIIKKKKLKFNVCYLFFFVSWFKKISAIKKRNEVSIVWNFVSKTFTQNNWKRKNLEGGGIISFYGIHFISILSYLKYSCVKSSIIKSKNKEIEWNAIFKKKKISINLKINIKSKEQFYIKIGKYLIYKADSPFGKIVKKRNKEDARIKFLIKYLTSMNFLTFTKHIKIIKLWKDVTSITSYTN